MYYASRTHSQLAQVIGELCQLKISASMSHPSDEADEGASTIRVVSLGSRKQLCINKPLVDSGGDLDEKCRELLTGSLRQYVSVFSIDQTKGNLALGAGSSPHGKMKPDSSSSETRFWYPKFVWFSQCHLNRHQATPKDIEDLATSGKLANICPYFSSRKAIRQAQVCQWSNPYSDRTRLSSPAPARCVAV